MKLDGSRAHRACHAQVHLEVFYPDCGDSISMLDLNVKGRKDSHSSQLESLTTTSTSTRTFPRTTFESLESLLIAISPGYVRAMTAEVGKRLGSLAEMERGAAVTGTGTGTGNEGDDRGERDAEAGSEVWL